MQPEMDSRPERLEATGNRLAAVTQNDTHCGRCGLPITSQRSIRVGYGRDCWPLVRDGVAA